MDEYYAEVLPHEGVRGGGRRGGPIAMVGDGISDAPALVQADRDSHRERSGRAIARRHSANEERPRCNDILALSGEPIRMRQNLLFGTGYNIVAIPLAAGVLSGYGIVLSPAAGAILMSASTILVAINARLLR